MNTARIVDLAVAVCAGGAAAYLASSSGPRPVEASVTIDTTDVLVARADIALGQTATPTKRDSVNLVRYGVSTTMTTRK